LTNINPPLHPDRLADSWPKVEADIARQERRRNSPEPPPEPTKADDHPGWTDDRLATLERMYLQGKTFEQMGRKLGISKVAAYRKIRRLGWEGRRVAQ